MRRSPAATIALPKAALDRLETMGMSYPELIIDPGAGESTHVFFGFQRGRKTPLASEFKILPVGKVNMPVPRPRVGFAVLAHYSDKSLIAMRLGDLVPGTFLWIISHADHISAWPLH